jgi:hypothetical protein
MESHTFLMGFFFLPFLCGPSAYASRSNSALWFIALSPILDFTTFSTSSALSRPLSREIWSYNPVIQMFPTFATSRLRDILAAKGGTMWDEENGPVKFSLKMLDFHVAFR